MKHVSGSSAMQFHTPGKLPTLGWCGHTTEFEYFRNTRGNANRTIKSYVFSVSTNRFSLILVASVLIIRVLYRLRTLSEQTPFEAATFSYAFPLFSEVLIKGGISAVDDDEALEQVALVLDVIKFHSGECKQCRILIFVAGDN